MSPRRRSRAPTALTARQAEVLALVAEGYSNRDIAVRLGISENGVKGHLTRLLAKFDVPTRTALVAASISRAAPAVDDVLPVVKASLADILGERATQLLLRRAGRLAGVDEHRLAEASLSATETSHVLSQLWPLLIESAGEILVRRLQSHGIDNVGDRLHREETKAWTESTKRLR